jgi:hypothetical protein
MANKVTIIPMTPELKAIVEGFRWRMERAEFLLNNPYEFGNFNGDRQLLQRALAAYLRENRDDE